VAAALTNSEFDGFRVAADSTEAATIYAHSLREVPRIDGFQEDWVLNRTGVSPAASEGLTLGNEAVLWAGNAGRYVYLYVEVTDDDLVYQSSPGESPYGDRLALLLPGGSAIAAALLLATSAPGTFRAQATAPGRFAPDGRFEDRVVAAWRATSRGYAVEVQLPLAMIGSRLGVAVIDVDRGGGGFAVSLAASW
jgi:hypothetical protein